MSDYPSWCAFAVCVVVLVPLLVLVRGKPVGHKVAWVILSLSVVLLFVATASRAMGSAFLGGDYSNREYAFIAANMWADLILGVYLAITRRWVAVIAAATLVLSWLWVAAMSSAV
jgi:hypothetical protein